MAAEIRGGAGGAALLVMDHQRLLVESYAADPKAHLNKVSGLCVKARKAGMPVIYIEKAFRAGYPEVHDNNEIFSAVKSGGRLLEADAMTAIPDEIAPQNEDIVVRGHRVSAFEGTGLSLILRARSIETLVMFGITTSGVVLSTLRQAADKDFRIIVLGDLCCDNDEKAHQILLESIFPKQAAVIDSSKFIDAL